MERILRFFYLLLLILTGHLLQAQCELTYILDVTKDAQVWSDDPTGIFDRGTDRRDIVIYEWTFGGTPVTKYGLLEFDFDSIPDNATINWARLSLFHDPGSLDIGHSTLSGSNESVIRRITSPWEESVAWQATPTTTTQNQIFLPATTNTEQDFVNIDVTQMVQDIWSDRQNSHGMLIQLLSTQYYRSLTFASSENPYTTNRPIFEINFTITAPDINVDFPADTVLCESDSFFIDASFPDSEYLWNTGSTDPELYISEPGTYEVRVTNYCDTAFYSVEVSPVICECEEINIDETEFEGLSVCEESPIILDLSRPDLEYLWDDGSVNGTREISMPGDYTVTVFNYCDTSEYEIEIAERTCECELTIPNIFTPNGDVYNETLTATTNSLFDEYTLRIYNRWGRLIFETNDLNNEWDGRSNGYLVPSGVYYWDADVLCDFGETTKTSNYSGYVQVIY